MQPQQPHHHRPRRASTLPELVLRGCVYVSFGVILAFSSLLATMWRAFWHAWCGDQRSSRSLAHSSRHQQGQQQHEDSSVNPATIKPKVTNAAKLSLFDLCVDRVSRAAVDVRGRESSESVIVDLHSDLAMAVFEDLKNGATLDEQTFRSFKSCSLDEINLRHYRSYCGGTLNDSWVFQTFNHFDKFSIAKSVRVLDISSSGISNFGFNTICSSCEKLEVLIAEKCCFIDDGAFLQLHRLGDLLLVLNLRDCHQVGGGQFLSKGLMSMVRLKYLDLSFCRGVNGNDLWAISQIVSLECVHLDGCTLILGAMLESFWRLGKLSSCSLKLCENAAPGVVKWLPDHLTSICFSIGDSCRLNISQLVGRFPVLHKLWISRNFNRTFSDSPRWDFSALAHLESLTLEDVNVEQILCHASGRMRELFVTPYRSGNVLESSSFIGLTNLTHLSLRGFSLRSNLVQFICNLLCLEHLDLEDCDFIDADTDFSNLKNLKHLVSLNVNYCDVEEFISQFAECKGLENLKIDTNLGHHPFVSLGKLTNLRELFSFGARVRDQAVTALQTMLFLTKLELCGGYLTDEFLEGLTEFKHLTWLNVSMNPGITDSGIQHLKALRKLVYLNVSSSSVSPMCLPTLDEFPALKHVLVYRIKSFQESSLPSSTRKYRIYCDKVSVQMDDGYFVGPCCAQAGSVKQSELAKLKESLTWESQEGA
eukprot:TRINITY_DN40699_c0_g1_i2.p1 TRINITY_DN40699_c0_g1~~TRINITY_DN40699_c0_g1_i2.p1  ORF type:complete len:705 (+),score=136.12 TRINITY_DN40699_c0_g1_i2:80-2194(+)